ncbi:MAG: transcriptional regulator [Anaerocolumna sp.]|nr:transcriptional regulator [Anaerocolumna sp.]
MNLMKLEYFIAVAKNKSFTKAAQKCHVAQPAISQQIKSLEQDLGFELIDRSTKQFRLTEAGQALYKDGIKLLNEFTYTVDKCRDISKNFTGTLRIGVTGWDETSYLIELVERLNKKYPNISVIFKRVKVSAINADLLNREYDCTLTIPYEFIDHTDIGYLNFAKCKAFALVNKRNPLSQKEILTGEEISSQNCIVLNFSGMEKSKEHLLTFFNEIGIMPSKITNVEDKDIMNIYVGMNQGVALVPECCEINGLDVVKIPIEGQLQYIDMSVVYNRFNENLCLKYFLEVADNQ